MNEPILSIIAGPIGNLGDLTLRALETLKRADLVVAEDTRVTQKLLRHYGIAKTLKSIRERSSADTVDKLIREINDGQYGRVAYLTDAGTPNISDPGGRLVAAARIAGIKIESIPGPSALTTLLQVAGININDGFLFLGFLPKKKGRQTLLRRVKLARWPVIIFERGERLGKTLAQFRDIFGEDATVVVGRELTKLHEEVKVFKIGDAASNIINKKGEFTVLIAPNNIKGKPYETV